MQIEFKSRTKIFRKIFLSMLLAIVSCVALTCGFIYFYMQPMLENSLIEEKRSMVKSLSEQEVSTLEEIVTYARNISFDDTVQNFFDASLEKNSYEYFSEILTLEKKLKEYRMVYGGLVREIFVSDTEGNVLETVRTYDSLMKSEVFERFLNGGTTAGFTGEFVQDYYGVTGKKNTIAYVNTIYDKDGVRVERGKLVILLEADKIAERFEVNDNVRLQLFAPDGTLVFDNLTGSEMEEVCYADQVGEEGWEITYTINNEDVMGVMSRTTALIVCVIVLILCGILLITVNLMKHVLNPLDTLIKGMKRVSDGSKKEYIEIHTGDECEEAATVFNEMVDRIDQHTTQLVDSEKKQFESQLKMLSYQLNPHFIYNTLNAIIALARQHRDDSIIDLTRAFIVLLQSLLRTDLQAMTTIEQEQKYINNYVHVLQMCYQNVPDITWEIEEGLADKEIPRMILYPLVENSIFHGIVPSDEECYLKISITAEQEKIRVCVQDNGIGCTREELDKIRKRIGSDKAEKHIGLFNVSGRLRLIYGTCEPLQINSVSGKGTEISFCFEDKKV